MARKSNTGAGGLEGAKPGYLNQSDLIKSDGYRCIAVKRGREVTLFSRQKKVLNKRFRKVVEALASLKGDFVPDGELVAFNAQGRPSFQVLQNNQFDSLPGLLLRLRPAQPGRRTFAELSIERRRELLVSVLAEPEDPLRLSPLSSGQVLEAVRKLGLEGVVGKRIGSIY